MKNGNVYINALKKLIENKPLDKVSVSAICAECSVTRQTFYNHFKDKHELLNWYFKNQSILFGKIIPTCDSLKEVFSSKLHFIDSQRKLYSQAFAIKKEDDLIQYCQNILFDRLNVVLQRNVNDEKLGVSLSKDLKEYCNIAIILTGIWTVGDKDKGIYDTVDEIIKKCPKSLKPYLIDKY